MDRIVKSGMSHPSASPKGTQLSICSTVLSSLGLKVEVIDDRYLKFSTAVGTYALYTHQSDFTTVVQLIFPLLSYPGRTLTDVARRIAGGGDSSHVTTRICIDSEEGFIWSSLELLLQSPDDIAAVLPRALATLEKVLCTLLLGDK